MFGEFSRFLVVGIGNTAIGYAVIFAAMYLVGLSPELSNILGYALCLMLSFVLMRNYTFRSKGNYRGELLRFLFVFAVAYVLNLGALAYMVRVAHMHDGVSQIVAGAVYVATSFLMNKYLVFGGVPKGYGR